jgi:hypothetical protein
MKRRDTCTSEPDSNAIALQRITRLRKTMGVFRGQIPERDNLYVHMTGWLREIDEIKDSLMRDKR